MAVDSAAEVAFDVYNRDQAWRDDPIHVALDKLPGKLITRARSQLVADASWYRSATFNDHFKVGGIDHQLFSVL